MESLSFCETGEDVRAPRHEHAQTVPSFTPHLDWLPRGKGVNDMLEVGGTELTKENQSSYAGGIDNSIAV
jgi:hypothetical protein